MYYSEVLTVKIPRSIYFIFAKKDANIRTFSQNRLRRQYFGAKIKDCNRPLDESILKQVKLLNSLPSSPVSGPRSSDKMFIEGTWL